MPACTDGLLRECAVEYKELYNYGKSFRRDVEISNGTNIALLMVLSYALDSCTSSMNILKFKYNVLI